MIGLRKRQGKGLLMNHNTKERETKNKLRTEFVNREVKILIYSGKLFQSTSHLVKILIV